jgi:hypothetical protein
VTSISSPATPGSYLTSIERAATAQRPPSRRTASAR